MSRRLRRAWALSDAGAQPQFGTEVPACCLLLATVMRVREVLAKVVACVAMTPPDTLSRLLVARRGLIVRCDERSTPRAESNLPDRVGVTC